MNFPRTDSQLDFLYNCITSYICGQVKVDGIIVNLGSGAIQEHTGERGRPWSIQDSCNHIPLLVKN